MPLKNQFEGKVMNTDKRIEELQRELKRTNFIIRSMLLNLPQNCIAITKLRTNLYDNGMDEQAIDELGK